MKVKNTFYAQEITVTVPCDVNKNTGQRNISNSTTYRHRVDSVDSSQPMVRGTRKELQEKEEIIVLNNNLKPKQEKELLRAVDIREENCVFTGD